MKTYEDRLTKCSYPGRGIIIGMTPDGKNLVQVYWIMGRSENSRNRIFEIDGDFVCTKAFDESKVIDPSLIIYYPSKFLKNNHIITNGDQTETVFDYIKEGKSFEQALKTRCFEPDPPNFTPRISGMIDTDELSYQLSILKTIDNNDLYELKNFYEYTAFMAGIGHCVTTYKDNGNPLPSFDGEPYKLKLVNDINENIDLFWKYLDDDNKVSLMVKYINVETKKQMIVIKNKNV